MAESMEVPGKKVIYCDPCINVDGTHRTDIRGFCEDCLEYLCGECYRTHRKPKSSRHHTLLGKNKMPTVRVYKDECEEECTMHPKKIIEYFCSKHNAFGCSVCMTLNHTSCKFDYVPGVSKGFEKTEECTSFVNDVKIQKGRAQRYRKAVIQYMSTAKNSGEIALKNINTFRKNMDIFLDILQRNMTDAARERVDEADRKYSEDILPQLENVEGDLEAIDGTLGDRLERKQSCQLFMAVKKNQDSMQVFKENLDMVAQSTNDTVYAFVPSYAFTNLLADQSLHLGELLTDAAALEESEHKHSHRRQGEICRPRIEARELNEFRPTDVSGTITAMITTPDDAIVFCDIENSCVRRFSIPHMKLVSSETLSSPPYDVTRTQTAYVVSQPRRGTLCFLSVTDLQYDSIRDIKVGEDCRGVVYHNKRLFVSFNTSASAIVEFDIDGNIVNRFRASGNIKFSHPCNLALIPNSSTLIVSDWNKKRVTHIALDGQLIATRRDCSFLNLRGIAASSDGTVFVCDKGNDAVYVLDSSLSQKIATIGKERGIDKPHAVLYSEHDQKLYVSMGSTIKCFQLFMFNAH